GHGAAATRRCSSGVLSCLPASTARSGSRPAKTDVPASTPTGQDRKSTRLNSSHVSISYAVFCLKKKKKKKQKSSQQQQKKKNISSQSTTNPLINTLQINEYI